MQISLSEAAKILGKTGDELMFLHQSNKIQASVDQDTLAWCFDLSEILTLKADIEQELKEEEEAAEAEANSNDS